MNGKWVIVLCLLAAMCALPAHAELQNVRVGGEVRIRTNYATNTLTGPAPVELRWPGVFLPLRSIGNPFPFGAANDIFSPVDWDDRHADLANVEQRTKLNVAADFTNQVNGFIEFDSYDIWGEDFRSDYVTGQDFRAGVADTDGDGAAESEVEVFQAYIEANEMYDLPLRLRIGRQELRFGKEWLVGANDFNYFFRGRSFDGIRLTYAPETFSIDAWWSKLAERSPIEQDGDVDFYGIYGSYKGIENHTFDAYWLWLRDARRIEDYDGMAVLGGLAGWWREAVVEPLWDYDDYDSTNLHTVGLRGSGVIAGFDYEIEGAYQFGDADVVGSLFRNTAWLRGIPYGDDDADFDSWACNVEVGYTFEAPWHPRPFIGFVYFDGEDNRDISFGEWLNPFNRPEASVSFNRLFSNVMYSGFLDGYKDMSNTYIVRLGVLAHPTEAVHLLALVQRFEAVEPFDAPRYFNIGRFRIPIAPNHSWWTQENDTARAFETDVFLIYNYSEDLTVNLQWSHLFPDDGLKEGNFAIGNGLIFDGGSDDDQGDYVSAEVILKF